MARTLFLRIDPTASEASWQLVENDQLAGPLGQGRLEGARKAALGAHVVVLIPAEEVFLSNVTLPGKNRNKLLKALPYAVEDQLVDDIDELWETKIQNGMLYLKLQAGFADFIYDCNSMSDEMNAPNKIKRKSGVVTWRYDLHKADLEKTKKQFEKELGILEGKWNEWHYEIQGDNITNINRFNCQCDGDLCRKDVKFSEKTVYGWLHKDATNLLCRSHDVIRLPPSCWRLT